MNTSKSGFGIMEVLAAAVVLGFLIVGLTRLQLGNRESLMRVRARDAANFVAQHVLDSISDGGLKALSCPSAGSTVYPATERSYYFEGKPNKNAASIKVETKYTVTVTCKGDPKKSMDTTKLTKTLGLASAPHAAIPISQELEAVVSWASSKKSTQQQSVRMAKVVR